MFDHQNDWTTFQIAIATWILGGDPYDIGWRLFANPPHSLPIFALLFPVSAFYARVLPIIALAYIALRLHKPYLIWVVGSSLPFFTCCIFANIDWLTMLGTVFGGQLGVLLDSVKPQTGAFAIAAELAKRATWRERTKLLLPLIILVVLTLPWVDNWLAALGRMPDVWWNVSLFPYTIPLGVVAVALAWRRQSVLWGVVASLCFSPYYSSNSYLPLVALIAIHDKRWGIISSVLSWLLILRVLRVL